MSGPERGGSWWRRIWPPSVQDSQTSQKSCEDEPGFSSSLNFLEEEDPGPLSQQLPATSSRGSEPLSNLDLSRGSLVNVEYLPFFRTYGQLLVEEVALQPDVGRDQEGVWSTREAPSQEDSEPPGGFSPYYRSKEESFLSLSWGRSQGPPTRREAQAGCSCRRTGSSGSSVSGEATCGGHRRVWGQPCAPWHPSDPCPRAPGPSRPGQFPSPRGCSQSSVSLVKRTGAGDGRPHSVPVRPLNRTVAWGMCLSLVSLSILTQE
ncbi:hypothetical protein HJG60_008728 [Phyllostomus discolor]|uniref:Uncharacterized protein n=1 Tax=Phyllostomus discolor TaxID=89673 RepID=A0A833YZ67_9CHIR|nr:hypothetical protein HJG60_008728 [Phyllostomus discolor]